MEMSTPADCATVINQILNQAETLVSTCRHALAALQRADAQFRVEEESEDHLAYRQHRDPKGRLSDLGKRVIERMLVLGWDDEKIASRTSVSPWGVGQFRRRLGRARS